MELAGEHLISMDAYDGHIVRPWHLWGTPMALYFNQTDNGHVRVRLLAKGDEYLEERPGTYRIQCLIPVGFNSAGCAEFRNSDT